MMEIVVDKQREAVVFKHCFFHPFVPIYRRSCEIRLIEIGRPFIARSGDGGRGNKILLPTKHGYVYFRDDRPADRKTLRTIWKARTRLASKLSTEERTRFNRRTNRLPPASKIALVVCAAIAAIGLWFYYSRVLPKL